MDKARTGRTDPRKSATRTLGKVAAAAWALALLTVPLACGGGTPRTPPPAVVSAAQSPIQTPPPAPEQAGAIPAAAMPPMMPGRIRVPVDVEPACPSPDFDEFIRAFFNSGDLQVRFTARPVLYRVPYYDYHNTEPGNPANPRWETFERDRPMRDLYRYEARRDVFVSDSAWLRAGEEWTGVDADGNPVLRPVTELQIRKVSAMEYAVDTPGRITTFARREDCWYLTRDWTLDPFEGCRWPDECRRLLEYEAPYYEDDED